MGFCTKCGQARTGDERFCTRCGTPFPAGPADAPDTRPNQATLAAGETVSRDAPADQPHPATELVSKPASREAAQEQEYPPTQAVSRPGTPAAAGPEYPAGPEHPAGPEYAQTQAVSKLAFRDQSAEPDTAVTTPLPGQSYPQYSQAPQYQQEYSQAPRYPEYPPDGGYSQPYQQPGPYQAGPYQPGGYQPGPYQQPGGYQRRGGPGGGKRAALVAVAVVFILAAGGGAYAVVSSVRGGSPGGQPTTALSSSPQAPPTTASPTDTSTAPASPTTPPATPSSTAPAGAVALTSQAAGNAASAQVVDLFNRYFDGINTHNYNEYAGTLDAGMRGKNGPSTFNSGYATTTDSSETIASISGSGARLTAVVTFTSHQDPANSVDSKSCNTWQLTLPLVAQGSGYLITSPPSGYSQYADC